MISESKENISGILGNYKTLFNFRKSFHYIKIFFCIALYAIKIVR